MATVKKTADAPAEPSKVLPSAEPGKFDSTLQESVAPGEGDTPEKEVVPTGDDVDVSVDPDDYKKEELKDRAHDAGVDDSGTKAAIAARLTEHEEAGVHKPEVLRPYEAE